jgi:4-hydroxythreonine-4-phosphate dehydrogenase
MNNKPLVGITLGDTAGIGPEITIKSLNEPGLYDECNPLLIGDPKVVHNAISLTRANLKIREVNHPKECSGEKGIAEVLMAGPVNMDKITYGKVDPLMGEAAVLQSQKAASLALAGEIDAICSAPVNKEAMRKANYHFEGQTQLFGEFCKVQKWGMLLIFGSIRCYMLTNHLALRDAIKKITKQNILNAIELVVGSLSLFVSQKKPNIAVSALNPHAGENGMFGREEIDQIAPAVEEAKKLFSQTEIHGPIPSDTVFVKARNGIFDAVISLFHDQANMAMKLIGFGEMITYVLGLPIIRTSVGHGTAFDIAGKNIANHKNLYAAIIMAANLAKSRKEKKS